MGVAETHSEILSQKIESFSQHRVLCDRLSWHKYFFDLAYLVAARSPDAQTRHGAVIVDKENRIVSTGYNGFPANGPDELLPNLRPEKYPYIVHAEMNALLSACCDVRGYSVYITGMPCKNCLLHLIGAGISKIFAGTTKFQEDSESMIAKAVLCEVYGVEVYTHSHGSYDKIEAWDHKKWILGT
jgi:dCMP deaminase